MNKSIVTGKTPLEKSVSSGSSPKIAWRTDRFTQLINNHGYEAYVDKAMRCPCVDKTSGGALSNCKNCLGRGYFFVDRKNTKVISQSMNNSKKYEQWSETNKGIAKITAYGIDRLGIMDRIILLPLIAYYYEILKPVEYDDELLAYPIYEPIEVEQIFLFKSSGEKLIPLTSEQYTVDGNKIVFSKDLEDLVPSDDINDLAANLSVAIRYSYHPVYHVIEINRELMMVNDVNKCQLNKTGLKNMPINVMAKKAHYIFDAQKFDSELLENTVYPTP